jgi:hypothetical protein
MSTGTYKLMSSPATKSTYHIKKRTLLELYLCGYRLKETVILQHNLANAPFNYPFMTAVNAVVPAILASSSG